MSKESRESIEMFAVSFIAICLMIDTDDVEVCPETKTYTLSVSGAYIDWRRLFNSSQEIDNI